MFAFLAAGGLLLYLARDQWFFGDEWDFLLTRDAGSVSDLLRPHNEHWSTLPILAYRALFNLAGVTSYLPYMALLTFLHVTLAYLSFNLLRRSGSPWVVALLAGVALILFGAGSENLLWAFQIGFVGSLVTFLAALLVMDKTPTPSGDWIVAGLMTASIMFSGIGVAAVAGIALTLMMRGEFGRALRTSAAPTLLFSMWFLGFRSEILGSHGADFTDSLLLLPAYALTSFESTVSGLFGFGRPLGAGLTLVLLALIAGTLVIQGRKADPRATAPLFMAVAVVGMAGLTRASVFGVEQAAASRYIHIIGTLLVVALGCVLFSSRWYATASSIRLTALLALFMSLVAISGLATLRNNASLSAQMREETRIAVLSMIETLRRVDRGEFLEESRPIVHNPDISAGLVSDLIAERGQLLPDTSEVTEHQALVFESLLQFQLTAQKPPAEGVGFDLLDTIDGDVVASGPDCVRFASGDFDPQVVIRPVGEGTLWVLPDRPGVIEVFHALDGAFSSEVSLFDVAGPDDPTWVWVIDDADLLRIDPAPQSTVEICNGDEVPES